MKKYKCIILDDYQNASQNVTDWSALDDSVAVEVFNDHIANPIALEKRLIEADIIVAMRERTPLSKDIIDALPNLKLIVTTGMRNSSIDMIAARDRGIVVCGTQSSSIPPAELTWGLLLALARNIVNEANNLSIESAWQTSVGTTLHGKNIGIIGLGKTGKQIAVFAKAFGMNVYAWSPNLTPARAQQEGVIFAASKTELLNLADVVTLHMVSSASTKGLLSTDDFNNMKRTALLINTSRAALIAENSLIEALEKGVIAGAAVDVFEQEPLDKNSIYRSCKNLLATPHLGYVSDSNYRVYYTETIEDINSWIKGEPVRTLN